MNNFEEQAVNIISDYEEAMRWWAEGDVDPDTVKNRLRSIRYWRDNLVRQTNHCMYNSPKVTIVKTLVI